MTRIAAVLRRYGADSVPEGYGDTWRKMLCPFHPDTHASAAINEELDAFSCLACGVKGNAVTLIMDREGCDARTADSLATAIAGPGEGTRSRSGTSGRSRARGQKGYVPPRLRGRAMSRVDGQ